MRTDLCHITIDGKPWCSCYFTGIAYAAASKERPKLALTCSHVDRAGAERMVEFLKRCGDPDMKNAAVADGGCPEYGKDHEDY